MDWSQIRQNIGEFFHGMALAGYEKKLREQFMYEKKLREQFMELNDLFMLLCFMELVGLPNPATIYLLEIYPYFLEEFHIWHRRMGMDHSPLGNLPCC
jgi:hypothetical protein